MNSPSVTDLSYASSTKVLSVTFDTGEVFELPAEYLRVESPSAEVQGHSPSEKKTIPGRKHVGIMAIKPIGNYAVQINFDDLHNTGFYTWEVLYKLGKEQAEIWAAYEADLERLGLSREP
ncbi:MAG: gamma-butyrobetaine hydroxylase-like domain-containing protein [Alphaproteobacteria bacterium]